MEDITLIVKDDRGNELLEIISVEEEAAETKYKPVNHCLAIVKVGADYLLGWNRYRQDWEIFGGCREKNETLTECIRRECGEELGLWDVNFSYIGLMHYYMAPGYFNPEWHYEYGGLYGISLPVEYMEYINKYRTDKEEIEKLAFYSELGGKEKIAPIDEKLLEYWE
ncbi:MAG: NUDIX domain-containing protein [Roseburia sp.]|nr:NUDIX domain-containing protein [Roseburia sp.]